MLAVEGPLAFAMPENPVAYIIALGLILLMGWGGRGFFSAMKEQKREDSKSDIDLTALVRKVAAETIQELQCKVASLERSRDADGMELTQLKRRVGALENDLANATTLLRSAFAWSKSLVRYILTHVTDAKDMPGMPGDLREYDRADRAKSRRSDEPEPAV